MSTKGSDSTVRNTINTKSSALTGGALALASLLKNSGIDAGTIAGLLKNIGGSGFNGGIEDAANIGFGDGTGLGGDWGTLQPLAKILSVLVKDLVVLRLKDGGIVPTPQLRFDPKLRPTVAQLLARQVIRVVGFVVHSGALLMMMAALLNLLEIRVLVLFSLVRPPLEALQVL